MNPEENQAEQFLRQHKYAPLSLEQFDRMKEFSLSKLDADHCRLKFKISQLALLLTAAVALFVLWPIVFKNKAVENKPEHFSARLDSLKKSEELIEKLKDKNPTVRWKALEDIIALKNDAKEAVQDAFEKANEEMLKSNPKPGQSLVFGNQGFLNCLNSAHYHLNKKPGEFLPNEIITEEQMTVIKNVVKGKNVIKFPFETTDSQIKAHFEVALRHKYLDVAYKDKVFFGQMNLDATENPALKGLWSWQTPATLDATLLVLEKNPSDGAFATAAFAISTWPKEFLIPEEKRISALAKTALQKANDKEEDPFGLYALSGKLLSNAMATVKQKKMPYTLQEILPDWANEKDNFKANLKKGISHAYYAYSAIYQNSDALQIAIAFLKNCEDKFIPKELKGLDHENLFAIPIIHFGVESTPSLKARGIWNDDNSSYTRCFDNKVFEKSLNDDPSRSLWHIEFDYKDAPKENNIFSSYSYVFQLTMDPQTGKILNANKWEIVDNSKN